MKQPLLIIGAGNVGGYLAWNLERFGLPYEVQGFLDDDPTKEGQVLFGKPVLGPVDQVMEHVKDLALKSDGSRLAFTESSCRHTGYDSSRRHIMDNHTLPAHDRTCPYPHLLTRRVLHLEYREH